MEFLDPIPAVGDEEFPDRLGIFPIEVNGVTPIVAAFAMEIIV